VKEDGILMYKEKIYVSYSREMKNIVLKEMHNVPCVGNPGYHKLVTTIRSQYFWLEMKKEVLDY